MSAALTAAAAALRIWLTEWARDMANTRDDPNISATRTLSVEGAEGGLRANNAGMVLLHGYAVMTTGPHRQLGMSTGGNGFISRPSRLFSTEP